MSGTPPPPSNSTSTPPPTSPPSSTPPSSLPPSSSDPSGGISIPPVSIPPVSIPPLGNSSSSLGSSSLTTSPSAVVTVGSNGQTTTITSEVTIPVSATSDPSHRSTSFWDNKGEVGGVFAAVGVVVLVFLAFLLTCTIRRHRARKFDDEVARAAAEAANAHAPDFDDDYGFMERPRPMPTVHPYQGEPTSPSRFYEGVGPVSYPMSDASGTTAYPASSSNQPPSSSHQHHEAEYGIPGFGGLGPGYANDYSYESYGQHPPPMAFPEPHPPIQPPFNRTNSDMYREAVQQPTRESYAEHYKNANENVSAGGSHSGASSGENLHNPFDHSVEGYGDVPEEDEPPRVLKVANQ